MEYGVGHDMLWVMDSGDIKIHMQQSPIVEDDERSLIYGSEQEIE
jgi:hypothetical protein